MPQHDLDIADQAGATFRAEVNSALQALGSLQSGATAPSTTYAYQYWLDTTTGQLKQRNAANSGWIVRATAAEAFTLSRSSNTILAEADRGKVLIATGSYTQTFTAAATLGDGWAIDVVVDSGVTLTLDPNSSETIDGATTKVIAGPAQGRVVCNGTLFRTIGFPDAYVYVRDEQTSGTAGGTFTSGGWRTRTLNTEVNDSGGVASLSANQVTLQAGTYRFRARAPAGYVDGHKCRLANVTDGVYYYGSNSYTDAAGAGRMTESVVSGQFTITAAKAFELQHYCQTTKSSDGFGFPLTFGVAEVYAEVEFWRVG